MNIEISDNLLEKYREVIKRRMLSDDVSKFVEILIEVELQRLGEEGYRNDGLTGCKNRFQVARDFKNALWENGRNDTSVFRNQYLCIDQYLRQFSGDLCKPPYTAVFQSEMHISGDLDIVSEFWRRYC